jgi:uncharacterized RDD family membrane protein YckC
MLNNEVRYAGPWVRLITSIIDEVIIKLICLILVLGVILLSIKPNSQFFEYLENIVHIIYTTTLIASKKQSTFAMRLFNMVIVDKNLQTLSLLHSIGRYFAIAFVAIFTLCLGFLTVFFKKIEKVYTILLPTLMLSINNLFKPKLLL